MTKRNIIVIAASSGGSQAMAELVGKLPENFEGTIFFVYHMGPDALGLQLQQTLQKASKLKCKIAENKEIFKPGHIYIAPPDHHMLIKENSIVITLGPKENRARPSGDALFRSAAAYHGPKVIGVVLSGMLDDGTMGLSIIKICKGITMVQSPEEATFPEMPLTALKNVAIDYVKPVAEIAALLVELTAQSVDDDFNIPVEVKTEAEIAERLNSEIPLLQGYWVQSPYICPDCNGGLWEVQMANVTHYRCHVGHVFSSDGLLRSHSAQLENALWTSLRMMEERRNMLKRMAANDKEKNRNITSAGYEEKVKAIEGHIQKLREILLAESAIKRNGHSN